MANKGYSFYRFNFAGLEGDLCDYEKSLFVILPVPYDATTSYGTGARKAPFAIIESSIQLELYDDELNLDSFVFGIHTLPSLEPMIEPENMLTSIKACLEPILSKNKIPIVLGGDHSISFAPIKAFAEKGDKFTVIHFDAHTDLRESYQGSKYSHACVMRRVAEIGIPIVQIGIRSLSREDADFLKSTSLIKTFFARDLYNKIDYAKILSSIKTEKIYISFDVDAFDPSIIPATGTPEPGGLNWYQVTSILKELSKNFDIVGFDVVELSPNIPSPSEFIVSKLIYKIIGYITKRRMESGY